MEVKTPYLVSTSQPFFHAERKCYCVYDRLLGLVCLLGPLELLARHQGPGFASGVCYIHVGSGDEMTFVTYP